MSETTTMHLICELTDDEIRDRAFQAGQVDQELEALADRFEVAKKDHKAEVGVREEMRKTLLREIRTKQTTRPVECEIERVYAPAFVVRTVRTDTGELVHERRMTDDERQEKLYELRGRDVVAEGPAA
jgi:hypothetical protein